MNSLFGIPYFHAEIDAGCYQKSQIIDSIIDNYLRDPHRNHWTDSPAQQSDLHHAYADFHNDRFVSVDFSSLIPVYQQKIQTFVDQLFVQPVDYQFSIVNYTCMSTSQFMMPHNHGSSSFSAVHYLQFDNQQHTATRYCNPCEWKNHIGNIFSPKLLTSLNNNDITNSWVNIDWQIPVNQDDFVITPGCVSHYVPPQHSVQQLRITVVVNITLLD